MRRWPALQVLLAAIAGAVSCASAPVSDAVVEQLRINVVVLADGSMEVTETLAVRAFAQVSPPFERHLRRTRVDRFADVRAAVIDAAPDQPAARVDVDRWGDVRVRWPDIAGEQGRTLRLQYRMMGALEIHGTRAWVQHRVAPLEPAYPVAEAVVELELPAAADIVEPPVIDGTGWTLVRTPTGATATRKGIPRGERMVLSAAMDIRALPILLPAWQQNVDRAREMAPAFLSGAFFIIVIGVGAVIMVRVQYLRGRTPSAHMSARDAGRGLIRTGIAVLVLGAATAAGAPLVIERYGRSIATIPGSLILVAAVMVVAGIRLAATLRQSATDHRQSGNNRPSENR
jgi:hypothetical protein